MEPAISLVSSNFRFSFYLIDRESVEAENLDE